MSMPARALPPSAAPRPGRRLAPRLIAPDDAHIPPKNIFKGVKWSLAFVGLLGYVYAVTTYRFPIGDVSMIAALVGLLVLGKPLRCPPVLVAFGVFIVWCGVTAPLSVNAASSWDKITVLVKLWAIAPSRNSL